MKKIGTKHAATKAKAKLKKGAAPKLKVVKSTKKKAAAKVPHDRAAAAKLAWVTIRANRKAAEKAKAA